jgi:hypothetical protein
MKRILYEVSNEVNCQPSQNHTPVEKTQMFWFYHA